MSKSRPPFGAKSRSFLELLAALTLIAISFSFANSPRSVSATTSPRLIISEVYPAAISSDSSTESHEWIEIQNLEQGSVSLDGWIIEDSQAIAALPDVLIPAGASVVVVGRASNVAVPPGKLLIILETPRIGNGLRNAGDRVALIDPYGVRHDAVSWGDVRTPLYMDPPEAGRSIVRSLRGGQRVSDEPTPWATPETIGPRPDRHALPRPDTKVRIVSARLDQSDDHPESVTIQNISVQPMLTINWRLTVDASSLRVRSVRINPGELYTITEADGEIGGGLSRKGGHFVLRDADGDWLATASWGDDTTFHRLSPPEPGAEVHFNPLARVHPKIPWHERFDELNRLLVGKQHHLQGLTARNALASFERLRPSGAPGQQTGRESVWISEVYPAAGQGRNDAAFEWFEITNSGDAEVDLSGWTIADNRGSDPLDGLIIPPQSSAVVAGSAEAGDDISLVIEDGRIGNGLANAGDRLALVSPDGEVVSAISWGNDRTHSSVKAPKPEESIHRFSPDGEPNLAPPSPGVATAFTATPDPSTSVAQSESTDPAQETTNKTPTSAAEPAADSPTGADSADSPSRLRITELLPAPLPGEAEWIEIFNPTNQPIDLTGWTIGDLARRTPLSGVIPARSYLVVATLHIEASVPVLVVDRIGNSLNNDADTITLYDPQGVAQFTISYGADDVPAPGPGLSLALDPERWVVTAVASPGSEEVTPLLDDAFRSPTVKPPAPEGDRLPLVAEPPQEGLNAWMIVSFALIGVILTLIVRRWQPEPEPVDEISGSANYSGPPPEPSEPHEPKRSGDNQPE